MLDAGNALVRLDDREMRLVMRFRECNRDRQEVLEHIAHQLSSQTKAERPTANNVVLLTGRKLR